MSGSRPRKPALVSLMGRVLVLYSGRSFTANLHVPSEDVSLSRNTGALLTIVEATSFKQINHLTLRFPPVPESVLNRHFQNIVKDLTVPLDQHIIPLNLTPTLGGKGKSEAKVAFPVSAMLPDNNGKSRLYPTTLHAIHAGST